MANVVIKKENQIVKVNDFIDKKEILSIQREVQIGFTVDVFNEQKHFLGRGIIDPEKGIILLTKEKEAISSKFFEKKIKLAIEQKKDFNGFVEGLPGLIAKKETGVLKINFEGFALIKFKKEIEEILKKN